MARLPEPRGAISALLCRHLGPEVTALPGALPPLPVDALADEDLGLALYLCYELHYRGFDGVHPEWEWEPSLLRLRRELERAFEAAVLEVAGAPSERAEPAEMDLALRAIAGDENAPGPSLSRFVERHATLEQLHEFLVLRSAYQLKEADPHSFVIPRLHGRPKAAIVEIQSDEYGGGRPDRVHADLFAKTLEAAALDATYGAYLDHIPAATLATTNLVSMLGLHRRWRAAAAGHLALFEMTSSIPSGRYARGLRRLGLGPEATDFFDEHVLADAVHENIAAVDLAGGLAAQDPALSADVLWGARALLAVDAPATAQVMDAWTSGSSALRRPLPLALPAS